tara:strand:+ start:853 stop:1110 length:258 start_codon:yes stop_codon:yes gene_type:complete
MIGTENAPSLVAGSYLKGDKRMAKVKMLRDTVASGFDVKAGKEYELDESDARLLIATNKAVPVEGKAKKVDNREAGSTTTTRKKK